MNRFAFLIISLMFLLVGLFIMVRSIPWGTQAANAYLSAQGGGMDTAQFVILLQEYIDLYRWIGTILAAVGGLGVVKSIQLR